MNRFTRYLLRAHIGPFFFAFVALTGIILINTLAKEMAGLAGKGLPMSVVLEFFILSLPANIALTMPMAVLVAVLYTFSSMAAENEITALRASGVDLRRVAMPLLVAAGVIAGTMMWFNDRVLPASNYHWRMLMVDVAQTRSLLFLEPQTINTIPGATGGASYFLEAQEIEGETGLMRKVTIYDVSSNEATRTIEADSGRVALSPQETDLFLTLYNGSMREFDFNNQANFQTVDFQRYIMRMEGVAGRLERTADAGFRTDRDMTVAMMRTRIDSLRVEVQGVRGQQSEARAAVEARIAEVEARQDTLGDPGDVERSSGDLPGELFTAAAGVDHGDAPPPGSGDTATEQQPGGYLYGPEDPVIAPGGPALSEAERYAESRARNLEYSIRSFQVEIHKKFAIASATLVFVLIGIPIALRFPRGGIGMVIAISLGIFGIYYVGLIGGETLGDEGYVPAGVAMWATNVIFGVLGLIGFMRLGQEQGTNRGSGWGEIPAWLKFPRPRRTEPVEAR